MPDQNSTGDKVQFCCDETVWSSNAFSLVLLRVYHKLNDDSSDGSVIAISEEKDEEEAGNNEIPPGCCLSLAAWDDETPGPSYSLSPANQEAAGKDEEGEECLIVGYKKRIAERTPEQLTSDSEEEKKKVAPPLPQSLLPLLAVTKMAACGRPQRETGKRRRRGRRGRRVALFLTRIVLLFPP
ncbi:hypothetical protein CgunFtcFv8_027715 [Champsocephalus gunnari]|uniref:Uncharacterized protein n=1 Tax=Champsocephalus gunnari TaxID=52237 RepID=A0AAN8I0Z3_CHAGU|nr:hypothetical protein CgunFtcFv8_027715 [Champsocephalus gunnari]